MKDMSQEVCVFGGIYFVSDFIINFIKESASHVAKYLPQNFNSVFSFLDNLCEWCSSLLFAVFTILLFRYLFTAKSLSFVQNTMSKYPKLSVYLYYFGLIGYIVLLLNALLFALGYSIELSETVQQFLVWCIIIANTCGLLLPLIFATHQVCCKQKYK